MTPLQVEEMERDRRQQHTETSRTSESPPMMPLHPPITPLMLPSRMMLPPPPVMPLQRTANNVHNLHHNSDVLPPVALGDFGRQTSASQYLASPVQAQLPTPSCNIFASSEGHHSYSVKDHPRSVHSPQSRLGSPLVSATAAGWDAQQRPRSVQSVRHRHGITPPEALATGSIGGLVGPGGPPRPMSSSSARCYGQASPLRPRSVQSSRNRAAPSPAFSLGAANLNDSGRCRSVQSAHSSSLASGPSEELQPVGPDAQLQFNASLSRGDAMEVDQPISSSQGHYGEPVPHRSCSVQSARNRTPLASTASSQVAAILSNQSMQSAHQRNTTSLVVSHPREQSRPGKGLSGETVMEVDHPKFLPAGNQGHYQEPPPQDSHGANSSRSQSASSFSAFPQVFGEGEGHHSLTSNFAVGSHGQHSLPKIDLSAGVAMEMRSLTSPGSGTSLSGQAHGDFASRDSRSVPCTRDRSASVALIDRQVSSRVHNSNSPHRCHSAQSARHRFGVASPFDSDPQDVTSRLGTYPVPVSSTIFEHLPKPSQPTFNSHDQFLPSDTLHSSDSPQAPHRTSGASAAAAVNPKGEIMHQTSAPCPPNSQQVQDAPWKPTSEFAALSEGATANVAPSSLGGAQPTTPSSSSASPSPGANSLHYRPGSLLSQAKAGGDDLHRSRRAHSAPRQSGITSPTNVRSERGPRTMTIDSLICYPDQDSSNVSLSAMDLDKATAPTSDAPSSSQGLVDPDPHRAHSAQLFHNSTSLPSEAAAQPQGLAQNTTDVTFDSRNISKSGVPSDPYDHMPLNFVEPAVTNNQAMSNEAFSGAVLGVPGSLNEPSGPLSQDLGAHGRNLESSGSSRFSDAVQDVPGSFDQPSGQHLRNSQDSGGQACDPGLSGPNQSGPNQVSETTQGVPSTPSQPCGLHPGLSQNAGGRNYDVQLSKPNQFPDALPDMLGSLYPPSGSYPPLSSAVDQQSYDPGSPQGSDMDVDCFLPRQQGDFLQGDANSNQHTLQSPTDY